MLARQHRQSFGGLAHPRLAAANGVPSIEALEEIVEVVYGHGAQAWDATGR